MDKNAKIYVPGHLGLVGSAIIKNLQNQGYSNLLVCSSKELDLTNQLAVAQFFENEKPEYVFLIAGKVGGILANERFQAEFLYQNLVIQNNIIHYSYLFGVKKLIFLGSSTVYPIKANQPLKESDLLTGKLDTSNEYYSIAKIAGIKMCEAYRVQYGCDFISVIPTNLYGPNDNYDLNNSHVLPALLRKFITAKKNGESSVTIWGTGSPLREFMHVDDLAAACLFLMENFSESGTINIGVGKEITILDLAKLIKQIICFEGEILTDPTMPDGMHRKLLDSSKLTDLGWSANISLLDGLKNVVEEIKDRDWSI
jgi:GDP-L-fucose synthase